MVHGNEPLPGCCQATATLSNGVVEVQGKQSTINYKLYNQYYQEY
jgi:hypothetical protein